MTSVLEFEGALGRFVRRARIAPATAIRKITLDMFSAVQRASPVDTGRFRANWRISLGAVDLSVSEELPGGRDAQGRFLPGRNARAAEVAGRIDDRTEVIFISNNVDYASFLERGGSRQAPAGVMRPAIDRVAATLRGGLRSGSA